MLGSTAKIGTGTNVQKRLIAVHDLDIPWRPADLEQRAGRIIRQGNENKQVQIFRYVTKGTFDAYSYQTLENKQKFISQIMTSKTPARIIALILRFNMLPGCKKVIRTTIKPAALIIAALAGLSP